MAEEKYLAVGGAIIGAARENGFLDPEREFLTIEELAEVEKAFFLMLICEIDRHLETEKRSHLDIDELSSLFSYVFVRGAEAANCYFSGQKFEADKMGMFDGKIPFYADDRIIPRLKRSTLPERCGAAFLDLDKSGLDPRLALLEALKWTWRLSVHSVCEFLEKRSSVTQKK